MRQALEHGTAGAPSDPEAVISDETATGYAPAA